MGVGLLHFKIPTFNHLSSYYLTCRSPHPVSPGYVGAGMLSAAVAGGVFASPPPASILAAILSLHNAGNVHV